MRSLARRNWDLQNFLTLIRIKLLRKVNHNRIRIISMVEYLTISQVAYLTLGIPHRLDRRVVNLGWVNRDRHKTNRHPKISHYRRRHLSPTQVYHQDYSILKIIRVSKMIIPIRAQLTLTSSSHLVRIRICWVRVRVHSQIANHLRSSHPTQSHLVEISLATLRVPNMDRLRSQISREPIRLQCCLEI